MMNRTLCLVLAAAAAVATTSAHAAVTKNRLATNRLAANRRIIAKPSPARRAFTR